MQQDRRKSYEELKAEAAGKWSYILEDLAPELADAIAANGRHVVCPVHGGRNNDGFRIFGDFVRTGGGVCNTCGKNPTGFGLLAWVRGYDFKDAIRDVAKWLRNEEVTPSIERRPPPAISPPPDPGKAKRLIKFLWEGSQELAGTPAERYLAARGIWNVNHPKTLRFHPSLRYYDFSKKQLLGTYPGMLAPVKNPAGSIVALHRTFLSPEGKKAVVPEVKKLTPKTEPLRGAAIKLFQSTDVLGLGEGIETMLAVYAITRMPVWSAVSAGLLEGVEVPESVRHVVIWEDKDAKGAGQRSAEILANRLVQEGRSVEVHSPPGAIPAGAKGIDWLDTLLAQGLEGFPKHWRVWEPAA